MNKKEKNRIHVHVIIARWLSLAPFIYFIINIVRSNYSCKEVVCVHLCFNVRGLIAR